MQLKSSEEIVKTSSPSDSYPDELHEAPEDTAEESSPPEGNSICYHRNQNNKNHDGEVEMTLWTQAMHIN